MELAGSVEYCVTTLVVWTVEYIVLVIVLAWIVVYCVETRVLAG